MNQENFQQIKSQQSTILIFVISRSCPVKSDRQPQSTGKVQVVCQPHGKDCTYSTVGTYGQMQKNIP